MGIFLKLSVVIYPWMYVYTYLLSELNTFVAVYLCHRRNKSHIIYWFVSNCQLTRNGWEIEFEKWNRTTKNKKKNKLKKKNNKKFKLNSLPKRTFRVLLASLCLAFSSNATYVFTRVIYNIFIFHSVFIIFTQYIGPNVILLKPDCVFQCTLYGDRQNDEWNDNMSKKKTMLIFS